jgi:hypothetical protein
MQASAAAGECGHGKFQATQRALKTVLEKVAGAKNFRRARAPRKTQAPEEKAGRDHLRMGVTLKAVAPRVPNLRRCHAKPQMEPACQPLGSPPDAMNAFGRCPGRVRALHSPAGAWAIWGKWRKALAGPYVDLPMARVVPFWYRPRVMPLRSPGGAILEPPGEDALSLAQLGLTKRGYPAPSQRF